MKHNSIARLKSIPRIRRTLSAIFVVLSIVTAFAAFGVPVNTSWTYQGQLRRSGAAYNGTCNFQFSLWDALSAGTQLGSTRSINSVSVVNGLFTVVLDFDDFFTGDARWLGTSVQCTGDSGFTPLDPRQPLTAAPYALSLRPGSRIEGFADFEPLLFVNNSSPIGGGIIGSGRIGLYGSTTATDGQGVYGQGGTGANGAGVWGQSTGDGPAIYGQSSSTGLAGRFVGPVEIVATHNNAALLATGVDGDGVQGFTNIDGIGVYGKGDRPGSVGVYGQNVHGVGVAGFTNGGGVAIFGSTSSGSGGLAGRFLGDVRVDGTLTKSMGSFRIDHPLDPANKFLSHSFVESPDMKNIYDGSVTTDATGNAIVTLPAYFEALNRDYRYQLTVLGQFAQAIVSRKIAGNSFEIRTDKPGIEVSWQVTGIRQDAYARAHPIVPEEFKPAEQQGMYLFPAGFGAGEEKRLGAPSRPATAPGAQEPPATGPGDQATGK